jgi:nucleotide-binding universal stress UspA family protein
MALKRILVHLDASPGCAARAEAAAEIACQFGSHLTGLYAINSAEVSHQGGIERRDVLANVTHEARMIFGRCTEARNVAGTWRQAAGTEAEQINSDVIMAARHHDLSVLGQYEPNRSDRSVPEDLVDQVVARSGRPVLVIPFAGRFPMLGQRVVIAWNESLEAARAVADAMPLLTAAKRVTVLRLANGNASGLGAMTGSSDFSEYLAAHGVVAVNDRLTVGRATMGSSQALLSYLAQEAADLLVMGAGGAVRARATKSLTRDILRQMTVPLMISR